MFPKSLSLTSIVSVALTLIPVATSVRRRLAPLCFVALVCLATPVQLLCFPHAGALYAAFL